MATPTYTRSFSATSGTPAAEITVVLPADDAPTVITLINTDNRTVNRSRVLQGGEMVEGPIGMSHWYKTTAASEADPVFESTTSSTDWIASCEVFTGDDPRHGSPPSRAILLVCSVWMPVSFSHLTTSNRR